jgi:hypothetical protein
VIVRLQCNLLCGPWLYARESNLYLGMVMKRYGLLTSLLICGLLGSAFAQSDAPATREDVLKLFNTMKVRDQMTLVMDSVAKQQHTMMHDAMRKRFPQITEQELTRLDQFSGEIMKDLPIEGMLDDMIPVYQKHLSKGDVDAMGTFYASPTGQKLLREMPAMTAESMQTAGPRIQQMMEKVMNRVEQMAKEDQQKQSQSPRPATEKN